MRKILFSALMLMAVPVFSQWDVTTPAGTEAKSLGDDRIRELKVDITTALNHEGDFPGEDTSAPKFIYTPSSGTTAQRPSGSTNTAAGMFYVNSSSGCLEQFNGSTWNCVQAISAVDAGDGLSGGAGSPLAVILDPLLFQVTTDSITFVANPVIKSSVTFSGNVTFASKPFFLAISTAVADVVASGGTVQFGNEVSDSGGNNFANGTTFTVPSTGTYFFSASLASNGSPNDAETCTIQIITTAATVGGTFANNKTDQECGGSTSLTVLLNTGNTATVTVSHDGTGGIVVVGTGAGSNSTHFSGYKVQN